MRFVVDNQLPPSLSRLLADSGHDSVHVAMVGLDASADEALWAWAAREARVVVSKDEDLFFLANRGGDRGRLLWVRIGNCRREQLHDAFARSLAAIVGAFESGQREFVEALKARGAARDVEMHEYGETGAPHEHSGFGRFAADAKDRQTNFLVRYLRA